MAKEIQNIISLYKQILENKNIVLESDVAGVDELVYNPVTGSGGEIGYGYDNGRKIANLTWPKHENHLHIGFTNRDVAMAVINKADSMGLITTENPFAKKDPNGKVDMVHAKNSFHYKIFPGEPKVGAGVDISGNKNKIVELIKWIETNYGGKSYSQTPSIETKPSEIPSSSPSEVSSTISSTSPSLKDPIAGQMFSSAFKTAFGLKESSSKNQYFLTFCDVSNRLVSNGQKVKKGQVIGEIESDVTVKKFDSSFYHEQLKKGDFNFGKNTYYKYGEAVIPSNNNTKLKSPIDGIIKSKSILSCPNEITIESISDLSNDRKEKKIEYKKGRGPEFKDPVAAELAGLPFKLFQNKYDESGKLIQKRIGYKDVDPWIIDAISAPFKKIGKIFKEEETKKIVENIEKIKSLLK